MAWDRKTLEECTEYITDGDHQPAPKSDDGVLFIKIKDIKDSRVDFKEALHVPLVYYEGIQRNRKPVLGDTLYTVVGSYGLSAYVNFNIPFCFERNIALLHPKKGVDSRFLFYSVNTPDFFKQAENAANGAAQKLIPLSRLKQLKIQVPPFATQKKIADILSAYDNLIENNQKQIKLLEEAAQRLYKQWFIDLHYPGHETTKIVDGLPEGWRKVTLGSALSKITTGLNPRKNFVLGQGKNFYVTIKNMGDNNIYLDDKCDRVNDEALEKINKRSDLKTGDILFSGIGTIGRVYLIDIPTNNWNVSESVFTMRVNECVSKEFLYLMLLSDDVQSYCDLHAHGVAQRGIRMADLKEYKFVLPENKIIDSFTTMVEPIIEKTQFLRKSINHAAESRDRLLPRLMNGELCL